MSCESISSGSWGHSPSGYLKVDFSAIFFLGHLFRRPCFPLLPQLDNKCRLYEVTRDRLASMFPSTRLVRVVNFRHCLCFNTVAEGLLPGTVANYTDVLCNSTNDRTTRKAISITLSTPTCLFTLQDVRMMPA